MTTFAEVINVTRNDFLLAGGGEQRNRLSSAVDSSVTSFQFTYDVDRLGSGTKLSVDNEDLSVWDVNVSSKTATVQRGDYGSTAAAHVDDSVVIVNPSVATPAAVGRAVNSELRALSSRHSGLYQMKYVDLTYDSSREGYDLTGLTNFLSIWQIRYKATGSEIDWPILSEWSHQPLAPTSDFASGQVLFIREDAQQGNPVRVWYRASFNTLSAPTDDVTAVSGLHVEAHDILSIGAAWRLTAGREVARNIYENQGDTRRATEVPPGANLGASRNLDALRADRIKEEAARLASLYPIRLTS